MNGVLGMLQMLMDTELDTAQQDFVVTAQESGKALINLINEVLDLAKIESGRIELETVPFDARDILDNVVSLFYEKSQAKGIELAVLVSNQVPDVLIGDPWRFRQIITNLVGNSMKNREVMDDSDNMMLWNTLSGLEVADSWKLLENFTTFKNSSEADAVNLVVRVEDTGIGITKDAQLRIFTPFMQADSSTSRTNGGTGIGLSITKRLVELKLSRNESSVIDGRNARAEITVYHLQRHGIQCNLAATSESAFLALLKDCSSRFISFLV
ncbi:hypothetical protein HU200_023575 [Digitaria exilis]|uniref:histidine kinase n=1 Tax=Digitaria exilis TaxID=1010633 RepID=A0A835EYB4_9POAL|nr:hypothetical protein HU200_023575 [Digitaria exilis]